MTESNTTVFLQRGNLLVAVARVWMPSLEAAEPLLVHLLPTGKYSGAPQYDDPAV